MTIEKVDVISFFLAAEIVQMGFCDCTYHITTLVSKVI